MQHANNQTGGDEESVISVEWESVEDEIDTKIPADLRHVIKREGIITEYTLDKYGYKEMAATGLTRAVEKHSQLLHPQRGPIDDTYLPVSSHIVSAIQYVAYGRDLNITEPAKNISGDETTYLDGLGSLVDAAKTIDTQRDDWYTAPQVMMGSFGPDQLGSLYISIGHSSKAALQEIDTDGLSIELEQIVHWGERPHDDDFEEHYVANYRHERYFSDEQEDEDDYAEEAAEVGLLGSNLGTRSSILKSLNKGGYEYEAVDELTVRGQVVNVYEYYKEEETRWIAEWSERVKIDELMWFSLVFNKQPDDAAISRAALIEEARLENDQ